MKSFLTFYRNNIILLLITCSIILLCLSCSDDHAKHIDSDSSKFYKYSYSIEELVDLNESEKEEINTEFYNGNPIILIEPSPEEIKELLFILNTEFSFSDDKSKIIGFYGIDIDDGEYYQVVSYLPPDKIVKEIKSFDYDNENNLVSESENNYTVVYSDFDKREHIESEANEWIKNDGKRSETNNTTSNSYRKNKNETPLGNLAEIASKYMTEKFEYSYYDKKKLLFKILARTTYWSVQEEIEDTSDHKLKDRDWFIIKQDYQLMPQTHIEDDDNIYDDYIHKIDYYLNSFEIDFSSFQFTNSFKTNPQTPINEHQIQTGVTYTFDGSVTFEKKGGNVGFGAGASFQNLETKSIKDISVINTSQTNNAHWKYTANFKPKLSGSTFFEDYMGILKPPNILCSTYYPTNTWLFYLDFKEEQRKALINKNNGEFAVDFEGMNVIDSLYMKKYPLNIYRLIRTRYLCDFNFYRNIKLPKTTNDKPFVLADFSISLKESYLHIKNLSRVNNNSKIYCEWLINDEKFSDSCSPSPFALPEPGKYEIKLIAKNDLGEEKSKTETHTYSFPQLHLSKDVLDFGGIAVGSKKKMFTLLSNTGDKRIENLSLSIIDNSSYFSISKSSVDIIKPDKPLLLFITFNPQSIGSQYSTLEITGSDNVAQSIILKGFGIDDQKTCNITGKVVNIEDSNPIQDVQINIFKQTKNDIINQTKTNLNGEFSLELPFGDYIFAFNKEGYVNTQMDLKIYTSDSIKIELKNVPDSENNGNIEGTISDSVTKEGVDNVIITIRKGIDVQIGSNLYTTSTDEFGNYRLDDFKPGWYTIEAYRDGYDHTYLSAVVVGNETRTVNLSINKALNIGQMQIRLRWGAEPEDIDAHLHGPNQLHVYHSTKGQMIDGIILDIDETKGYGPETITVNSDIKSGTYLYSVYDYDNPNREVLYLSKAEVTVIYKTKDGLSEVKTFNIPNEEGNYWKVFQFDNTIQSLQDITILNRLDYISSEP